MDVFRNKVTVITGAGSGIDRSAGLAGGKLGVEGSWLELLKFLGIFEIPK